MENKILEAGYGITLWTSIIQRIPSCKACLVINFGLKVNGQKCDITLTLYQKKM